MATFPSEFTTNEFPEEGGLDLTPVVQYISVEVVFTTGQLTPSITTVGVVPNPDPVIWTTVPPTLGPNEGSIVFTTEVAACE